MLYYGEEEGARTQMKMSAKQTRKGQFESQTKMFGKKRHRRKINRIHIELQLPVGDFSN